MRLHPESPSAALWVFLLLLGTQLAAAASAVLGIDLGQEFIKAALVKPGIPLEIVPTKDSKRKEASAIGFKSNKGGSGEYRYPERTYGADAINLMPRFPKDVYPNLKQLLGAQVSEDRVTTYSSRYPELNIVAAELRSTVAFRSSSAPPGDIGGGTFTVEELLAMQLQNIVRNAETMAGKGTTIKDVVITVPPYFTAEERYSLYVAADIAGLRILSLVSDGVAVALNYATSRQFSPEELAERHIIYDMGAGSTKATIVEFKGRSVKDVGRFKKNITELSVLGVGFDRALGGDLFNERIVKHLLNEFVVTKKSKIANDPSVDLKALSDKVSLNGRTAAKLWREATRVRHILSANSEVKASIESLYDDIDFKSKKITRTEYEEWLTEYSERVLDPIHSALKSSGLTLSDIKSVVLHGGAIRTPFVGKLLTELVGEDKINKGVNSDEAAVMGATFRGAGLSKSFKVKEVKLQDLAVYPAAAQYKRPNSDKEIMQIIFPAYSKLGVEKLLPIERTEDFSFSLSNIFPPKEGKLVEEERVVQVVTRNLTNSVKALQGKFKCSDATRLRAEFGIRLSEKDAQPEVTTAWTGCDVEYEDVPTWENDNNEKEGEERDKKTEDNGGIVGDVKGFFGFGKKKTDGEQVVLEEVKDAKDLPTLSSTSPESTITQTSKSSGGSTDIPPPAITFSLDKDEKPNLFPSQLPRMIIKKFEKVPIEIEVLKAGLPGLPEGTLTALINRLKAFDENDGKRRQREEIRNKLEAFVYKIRSLANDDKHFIAASSTEALAELKRKVSEIGDWIYEEGESAILEVLKDKLKSLKDLEAPISRRKAENVAREDKITSVKNAVDQMRQFVGLMKEANKFVEEQAAKKAGEMGAKKGKDEAAEERATSSSPLPSTSSSSPSTTEGMTQDSLEDLDDDIVPPPPPKMEEEEEKKVPVTSSYSDEEIASLKKSYESVQAWLDEKLALQAKRSLSEDPAVTIQELDDKLIEINDQLIDILDRQLREQRMKEKEEKAKKEKVKKGKKKPKDQKKEAPPKHDEL